MTGFTPGPWFVVRYGDGDSLVICRDEAGDQRVAFLATPGCRDQLEREKTWKRIKCDAHLIAAAPELFEALAAEEALWQIGLFCATGGQIQEVADLRQAALAKAKGETQ